jgi:hypothetical protein
MAVVMVVRTFSMVFLYFSMAKMICSPPKFNENCKK